MKRGCSLWVSLFLVSLLCSQPRLNYIWPIDSPHIITGNYGEIRPNHFHAGIDFSTLGKINLPVYSAEEGYVSRIRVSSQGYGKCVYITHPDGKVSVYAHLNSFSLKLDNIVSSEMLARRTNEIDFNPPPRHHYVRRNEIIGLSGNSGGSTGPHLHFELRDENSEIPLNPFTIYRINDQLPPEMKYLALFDLSDTNAPKLLRSYPVRNYLDTMRLEAHLLHSERSIVGLGFSGFDKVTPAGSENNIYGVDILVDGLLIYSHRLDSIAFHDHRYVNEFVHKAGRHLFQKCFLPTLYPRRMHTYHFNKGRIFLEKGKEHLVKMVIRDEYGSRKALVFKLKARAQNYYSSTQSGTGDLVPCNRNFLYSRNGISLIVPSGTLFRSTVVAIEGNPERDNTFTIIPGSANLRTAAVLGMKVPPRFTTNSSKLLLTNKSGFSTPTLKADSIYFSIRHFDRFSLALDTVPPVIKPLLSEKQLKNAWLLESVPFRLHDAMSGIGRYDVWLNDEWVIAEYDAKTSTLVYVFDEDSPFGILTFKIRVEDRVGNFKELEFQLRK